MWFRTERGSHCHSSPHVHRPRENLSAPTIDGSAEIEGSRLMRSARASFPPPQGRRCYSASGLACRLRLIRNCGMVRYTTAPSGCVALVLYTLEMSPGFPTLGALSSLAPTMESPSIIVQHIPCSNVGLAAAYLTLSTSFKEALSASCLRSTRHRTLAKD